jgi:hypothetical protein
MPFVQKLTELLLDSLPHHPIQLHMWFPPTTAATATAVPVRPTFIAFCISIENQIIK